MKGYALVQIMLILCAQQIFAQDQEGDFSVDLSADIVSRYVWRGLNLSESPAVQPMLGISYRGFSFGSWASYTFAQEAIQEVDLYLGYQNNRFGITLNNYYNTLDTLGSTGNYFNVKPSDTPHVLEGVVSVYGPKSFPITLTLATMFYGNDRDEDGKNLYSSYVELDYPISINSVDAKVFFGITPAKGLYAEKFRVVNVGISASRGIPITEKFELPIKGSFMVNPSQEKVFFVISITL